MENKNQHRYMVKIGSDRLDEFIFEQANHMQNIQSIAIRLREMGIEPAGLTVKRVSTNA